MKVHTYENSGGKDLIKKYIDKLSKEEQVDGYSVLQAFEEDRIDELNIKPWQGKSGKYIFISITEYFMYQLKMKMFICCTPVENKKIKLKQ